MTLGNWLHKPLTIGPFRFRPPAILQRFANLSRSELREHLRSLSDHELEEIRDSGPPVRWEELTDRELDAVGDGEPLPPGGMEP